MPLLETRVVGLQWLILIDQLVIIGILILILTLLWNLAKGKKF